MTNDLNAYQRRQLRAVARRIIDRFEQDDRALADRAAAARPDGYPAGGSEGGSGGDVSNPTLSAVLQREKRADDRALVALKGFAVAVDTLINADKHRADALPPVEPGNVDDGWCISCIRIDWHSPRNTEPKDFAQPCKRCTWCAGFWRDNKFDPPEWMLIKRARGGRITTADVDRALLEHRRSKKKRR